MLQEQNSAVLTDLSGKNDIRVDINFTKDKDRIIINLGGKSATIKISEIYNLCMIICGPDQIDNLMPIRRSLIDQVVRVYKIRATKDIKRGEEIKVNLKVDIPKLIIQNLNGNMNEFGI